MGVMYICQNYFPTGSCWDWIEMCFVTFLRNVLGPHWPDGCGAASAARGGVAMRLDPTDRKVPPSVL